jgi:hypothetical protein
MVKTVRIQNSIRLLPSAVVLVAVMDGVRLPQFPPVNEVVQPVGTVNTT